jgi:hypothetical protein
MAPGVTSACRRTRALASPWFLSLPLCSPSQSLMRTPLALVLTCVPVVLWLPFFNLSCSHPLIPLVSSRGHAFLFVAAPSPRSTSQADEAQHQPADAGAPKVPGGTHHWSRGDAGGTAGGGGGRGEDH